MASEEKKDTEKWKFFNWFFEFVKYKKIDYYSLKNLSLPSELTKMNPRVKGMDALILACAIEDYATLITLDRDLLKAEGIKNKYKVKILTPEEIIS